MVTNRLLFAAARGARIDYFDNVDLMWVRSTRVALHQTRVPFRIHPDDTQLQYGPISTALRERAETGKTPCTLMGLMADEAAAYEAPYPSMIVVDRPHRDLFLLILAEALADEGL